jgi:hypothetical protein
VECTRMDPPVGQVTTPIDEFGDYAALDPFFRTSRGGPSEPLVAAG